MPVKRIKRQYQPQPRLGFSLGDKVRVKCDARGMLSEESWYGTNVGEIIGFLDDPSDANNGAALLQIKTAVKFNIGGKMEPMETRPYINTDQLVKP